MELSTNVLASRQKGKAMKQQTFIIKIYNVDGNYTSFERFSCKKSETVKRQFTELLNNSLYATCLRMEKAAKAVCYATPDGITIENSVWEMRL